MAAPTLEARAHSGPSYTTLLDSTAANFALWLIGVRPAAEKLNVRMFAATEDPAVLADAHRWAFGQIADYAHDLQQVG